MPVSVFTICYVLVRLKWLSDHLLGKSCSLGSPYVLFVKCLFEILVISHFSFEDRIPVMIVPVPGYCLLFTFSRFTVKGSS